MREGQLEAAEGCWSGPTVHRPVRGWAQEDRGCPGHDPVLVNHFGVGDADTVAVANSHRLDGQRCRRYRLAQVDSEPGRDRVFVAVSILERAGDHPAALRHLYNRMLGQLYHCLHTDQPYNPEMAFPVAPPHPATATA